MSINMLSRILNALNWLKKRNVMKDSMIVGLVVNPMRSNRLKNILFGEIMHLTVGAGIGSIIAALLKKTGKKSLRNVP